MACPMRRASPARKAALASVSRALLVGPRNCRTPAVLLLLLLVVVVMVTERCVDNGSKRLKSEHLPRVEVPSICAISAVPMRYGPASLAGCLPSCTAYGDCGSPSCGSGGFPAAPLDEASAAPCDDDDEEEKEEEVKVEVVVVEEEEEEEESAFFLLASASAACLYSLAGSS